MQFDKTRIAIRERSGSDILDLALHVIRSYAGPLALACAAGAVPTMLFNGWLLGSMQNYNFGGYLTLSVILTLIELPLASAPITLYLGQALFIERPRARQMARDYWHSLPQLVLFQFILRGLLFVPLFLPYIAWPFLSEIILLERNPLVARSRGELSTMRRNSALHEAQGGMVVWGFRVLLMQMLALLLITAIWFSLWFLLGLLTGDLEFRTVKVAVGLELAVWIVAGYFTVVRFLSYLDLRIRREGWEVELALRAQRARLTRQLA